MDLTFATLFAVLVITALVCFFSYYCHALTPRQGTLEWIARANVPRAPLSFTFPLHPMGRRDALPMLLLTAVYAATAFFQLGDITAPQSFLSFSQRDTVSFRLDKPYTLSKVGWYTGLGTGEYLLEVSEDGVNWNLLSLTTNEDGDDVYAWVSSAAATEPGQAVSIRQDYASLFKWEFVTPLDGQTVQAQYFRITGEADHAPMELGELALYDETGALIADRVYYTVEDGGGELESTDSTAQALSATAWPLFNEQDLIPERSSWHNSMYFDEIYHGRTADEFVRGLYPYEQSHPPLGKLIISLGIQLFGMTPFGWRFMGALFGVLMVPLLYVFLKNMFGKTAIALCGSALFAFDFMHLTQTRIATIDTYTVFFVLAMYYFMYRYLAQPAGTPLRRGALPLFLSGLMFGIGTACKWPVLYGGAGLAVLYFIGLYFKCRDWPAGPDVPRRGPWVVRTLLFSVLCFVLIPGVIYILSYLPYAAARGGVSTLSGALAQLCAWPFTCLPQVLSGERALFVSSSRNLVDIMLDNQHFMFTYHIDVHTPHPYESRWYQWLVDARPILYYMDNSVAGYTTRFAAFHNPVVCWGGLAAIIAVAVSMVRRRCGKALFILVGYLAQLLPWVFITRITFAYHYFPSALFLCFALAYVCNDLAQSGRRWKPAVYSLTAGAVGLYALFYPELIGLQVPTWFTRTFLRWFSSWPL